MKSACGIAAGVMLTLAACSESINTAPPVAPGVCRQLQPLAGDAVCELESPGSSAALLITGQILGANQVLGGGQVLIDAKGLIACVGCDCSEGAVLASAARLHCPSGVISPGLINPHDHLSFTHNPPAPDRGERYEHRHDWRVGLRGHTAIPARGGATREQILWGELRFLLGGATSIAGQGGAPGFLRNLDAAELLEGLPLSPARLQTFPLNDAPGFLRRDDCDYGVDPDTAQDVTAVPSYLAHVAEGIDAEAVNEFPCVSDPAYDTIARDSGGGTSNDLVQAHSSIVHGVALRPVDYAELAREGASLVWSPRSNIALYGDTAAVTVAHRAGINIALGSDWTLSGSMNMLRELHCAAAFNRRHLDGYFSDEAIWRMATINAAKTLGAEQSVGTLAPGMAADIAIFDGRRQRSHSAVVAATPPDVVLVLRGGKVLYGESALVETLAPFDLCEGLSVCGSDRRICALRDAGRSYAVLALQNHDAYPAYFCDVPAEEPSCSPLRDAAVNGSGIYDGEPRLGDFDGDGVNDSVDNCPRIFNPVRPMDEGRQADADGDGLGDVCDPCPLSVSCPSAAS